MLYIAKFQEFLHQIDLLYRDIQLFLVSFYAKL